MTDAVRGQLVGSDARPLLSVDDLEVRFSTPDGTVHAVNGVSFDIQRGETLGIVGESGSGKSVSVRAVMGLVRPPGKVTAGSVVFDGNDMRSLSQRQLRKFRGRRIALVPQDPMTSFNPVVPIGAQITEMIRLHDPDCSKEQARARGIALLESVGVPSPERRFDEYPHQYSGGMRQRAMIAMAVANSPDLLIADEPTTALDVTIQAQVLEVLQDTLRETDSAMILITHDLGVIAELADRVVVMYAGKVVEYSDVRTIFHNPRHPYTVGLLSGLPRVELQGQKLTAIPGNPPSALQVLPGCSFEPRCSIGNGDPVCRGEEPPLAVIGEGHGSACHYHDQVPELVERVLIPAVKGSRDE
ncbi:MAG: ABC transporter ATP-binding protein [Acidimicrobiia bacterium]